MERIIITKETIEKSYINDPVYCINKAILSAQDDTEIILEKGEYELRQTYAFQHFLYMSNNDFGLKNIAFPVIGKKNITIDCGESKLIGIGNILPFYISDSENIQIKNFTLDYKRPFYTQGEIVESTDTYAVLKIDKKQFPYTILNGVIRFIGEDYESDFIHNILEFEPVGNRPLKNVFDNAMWAPLKADEISEDDGIGLVKIYLEWSFRPTCGNVLTIKHERRYLPAIALNCSDNVKINNATVYHAGTMGVVAQFTKDISIDNLKVMVEENSDRVMSVNADATHFVNCTGTLILENSILESQLDDVINVHGNYLKITKVIDSKTVIAEIPHRQQVGAYGFKDGCELNICNAETMLTLGQAKLKETVHINNKYYQLNLENAFPFKDGETYGIDDVNSYPKVIFRNNICGKNRARGLLLTGNKEILIENNIIDAEGTAIKVNGDMDNWYESTNTSKIIIRGNTISKRNEVNWGVGIIDIDPGMLKQVDGEYFHGDMIVEDNKFILGESPFFYGFSFKSLDVKNNTFICENSPVTGDKDLTVKATNCGKITLSGNKYQ